jgi:sensor histidine kinase YesM
MESTFEPSTLYILLWTLVFSINVLYAIFCGLIYAVSRLKEFLYYGLYNLFLLTFILLKAPFGQEYTNMLYLSKFGGYNWFSQNIYLTFFVFFYVAFLDMHLHFPKMTRLYKRFMVIGLLVGATIFAFEILNFSPGYYAYFFIYIFSPLLFILTLIAIYLAYKTPNKLGIFVITGVLFYNFFAFFALYKSMQINPGEEPIKYFYIGILIESLVFMFGLGYKVNLINSEKMAAQQAIIKQQNETQKLHTQYQEELEQKLNIQAQELHLAQEAAEKAKIKSIEAKYQNELQSLRLASLQSQMNPHFLFNALNSIKYFLIENHKDQAIQYLNKFSKLIRKILESSRIESQSLDEELNIIELYLNIENIRFEEKIEYSIVIDCPTGSIRVPPLILQPFVENAIWHGLMLSDQSKLLEIRVFKQDGIIKLSLKDNGVGRQKSASIKNQHTVKKDSVGLKLTEERLGFFNQKFGLDYRYVFHDLIDSHGDPAGTEVIFSFKLAGFQNG